MMLPMKCDQCERPAVFDYSQEEGKNLHLCLDCSHKLQAVLESQQSIRDRQWLTNAAMLNQANADMDAWYPVGTMSRMIPVAEIAKAMSKATVFNNIHVSNSNVGVLNTGDLARIDAYVTATGGTEVEPIGQKIAALTQAIVDAQEVDDATRKDLIELVQGLSQQLVGERKQSVMKAILTMIEERAKGAAAVVTLAKSLGPMIASLFGP
jgi:hypothetical protein